VDPREQVRIIGRVRPAVGRDAVHAAVDVLDARDQRQRVAVAAVGGAGHELRGASEAALQVVAKIGVVPDAGQRARVQRLQQQRADAARHHRREIGVDLPADGVWPEQAGVARRRGDIEGEAAGGACHAADLADDAFAQRSEWGVHGAGDALAAEAGRIRPF